jgi:DnaJ family protein C protein 28
MDEWRIVAERKIREAMEDGAFEYLEGAGKPLDLRENPFEDPSDRMANRLLKNNGLAPAWIEEAKEIERESASLRGGEAASDFQTRVARLNRRIVSFNLTAPLATVQKRLFDGPE